MKLETLLIVQEQVAAFLASGKSLSAWCRENDVSYYKMRHHVRKAKKMADVDPEVSANNWLQVATQEAAQSTDQTQHEAESVWLHIGEMSIEVRPGFNPAVLREVVKVLTGSC